MNTLDYLLKANLYGLLFVSCYWLFLRRHTFFTLNRAYLVASVVLSLTLPLVTLPSETVETLPIPVGVIALPITPTQDYSVVEAPEQINPGADWEQIGLWFYGFVGLSLLIRLGIRIGRLFWLIRRSPRQVQDSYVLVQPDDGTLPTFSFFNYIILNPADTQNGLILRHELVHVRQWHSADVLGLGIIKAIFWACPTLFLIERMLRQVHEFLADKEASQPNEYARFLVAYTFGLQPDALTNGFFNPSLLKLRIQMLHQKTTNRRALGKYMLVLPLAISLLAMTTAREEIVSVVSQVTDKSITVSGKVTGTDGKPLIGANVVVVGTNKGTSTDSEGRYTLNGLLAGQSLAASFTGYKIQFVALSGRTKVNISLAPTDPDELPTMGATAVYKAIKPNPSMPVRTPPSSETINGEVFTAVEEPAVFPTGIPGLMQYVAHTLHYPAKAKAAGVEGKVLIQFTVLSTGAIGSAKVKKGIGNGCDEEALRVVKQMPRWLPGKQNGKSVATQHVIPIQFALEKREDKRTGQLTPKPDSSKQLNFVVNNSKNSRFALYGDAATASKQRYSMPLPDTLKQPGESVNIRTTGFSIGDPLYIIDGIEANKAGMAKISPNKIENVTVLKGASAGAYGEKGKNGVILITTKTK
ncbi:M56 family metallopeptidase [Spirosoma pollinicola]|uniref:TonB C-terminal domain-containing protein n=1 Tax=Spirosoma pollinicola TaxID=2057025 RepID=A0A2K8Z0B3_9BACT|nr:M56 family metallopeptidase [Spirosoma pollinicola]AUD03295.1 hypothetical protein CWM47_16515 [Spirosoma pollinicola]